MANGLFLWALASRGCRPAQWPGKAGLASYITYHVSWAVVIYIACTKRVSLMSSTGQHVRVMMFDLLA